MDDPSAGSPTERCSPSRKKKNFLTFGTLFLSKARVSLGPDYILRKKKTKKDNFFFFFFARQHLVCGLHPWEKKKNEFFFFPLGFGCVLVQSPIAITIPKIINLGHTEKNVSIQVW